MGLAEVAMRLTRIVTAIALARSLSVAEFGVAAAVLTVHELTRMFIQNGLGTRVVTAPFGQLESIASSVWMLNWILGITLFVLQLAVAIPAAHYFNASTIAPALCVLAFVHVIYPFSMVQVYLAQRQNRWRLVSGTTAIQAAIDNILMAILALMGFGVWSVVIPKIAAAISWTTWHRFATRWTASAPVQGKVVGELLAYALRVLGVEMLATLRQQGDKLAIGAMAGPVVLGMYAFAANIGSGITTSLSQTLGSVVLPFLTRGHEYGQLRNYYLSTLWLLLGMTVPFVLLQATFAEFYVPIVFGERWVPAIPLLIILSIASLARPFLVATSQMLRAHCSTTADLRIGIATTFLYFGGLFAGWWASGIEGAAIGASAGLFAGSMIALVTGLLYTRDSSAFAEEMTATTVMQTATAAPSAPRVSIIIPCYNCAETISQTIESVQAQTVTEWELIVVDDGSTDATCTIVEQLCTLDSRIKFVAQANAGPSIARNNGVAFSSAPIVAFLDADDLWVPEHLEANLAALRADSKLGISFGGAMIIAADGSPTGGRTRTWERGVESHDLLASNPTATCSSLVFRREVYNDAGGLRSDMKFAEDQEWLFRVSQSGWLIRGLPLHTIFYRTNDGSLSSQLECMREGWERFIDLAREVNAELVAKNLPWAKSHMHLYWAQRAVRSQGAAGTARAHVFNAVRSWPLIILESPRRFFLTMSASFLPRLASRVAPAIASMRHA